MFYASQRIKRVKENEQMEINRICEYASAEKFEEANFYISPQGRSFVFVLWK